MKPSQHPESCAACHGSGYVDGPDEYETVNGEQHRYTTVMPCRREWQFLDEPTYAEPPDDRRYP